MCAPRCCLQRDIRDLHGGRGKETRLKGFRIHSRQLGNSELGNIYLVQQDTRKHFFPIRGGPGVQRGFFSVYISKHHSPTQAICCRQLNLSYHPTSSHQVDQKKLGMSRTPQRLFLALHGCHSQQQGKMGHCWAPRGRSAVGGWLSTSLACLRCREVLGNIHEDTSLPQHLPSSLQLSRCQLWHRFLLDRNPGGVTGEFSAM